MTFSRIRSWLLLVLCLQASAAAEPLELLRRHRYEEAIRLWKREQAGGRLDENGLRALKGKAIAYQKLGSLYAEFHEFSLVLMEEYYRTITQDLGNPLALVYLGQIQYYDGRHQAAARSLQKALASDGLGKPGRNMGEIYLYHAKRKLGQEASPWRFDAGDNAAAWQALELEGKKPSQAPPDLKPDSQRGARCRLQMSLRDAQLSVESLEGLMEPVLEASQKPEAYFDRGKNTQINFYDPLLLLTLSEAYYSLSKGANLVLLEQEGRFRSLASKFNTRLSLAEVSLRLDQLEEAEKYLDGEGSPEGRILKAELLAQRNEQEEARQLLERVGKGSGSPSVKRDIAHAYHRYNLDLGRGLYWASEAVKERNHPLYHRTLASILLSMGKSDEAVARYSKGYKIEHRNRIDQIDPEYMAEYALAIFKANKLRYEEVVETLYHLQKEFPPCRQMYYCMQGISAALARNYESQKIFRKGG